MKYYSLLLSLICILGFEHLVAQPLVDDSENYGVLVFEHLDQKRTKFIRVGGWIKYRLYSNPRKVYKGTLQKVTKSTMIVEGAEIKLSDCQMIAGRVRTDAQILGAVALGMGIATSPFAIGIASVVTLRPAAVIVGSSVALIVTGFVILTRKKRFKMDRGWAVYGGSLQYSRIH